MKVEKDCMKIYVGHSRKFNFEEELYVPLKNSSLGKKHVFFFPHENEEEFSNSKEVIKNCDLMLAEVTFPSTGLGIELGWANAFERPVIFLIKKNTKVSQSLKAVSQKFIEYENAQEMVSLLEEELENMSK